MSQKTNDWVDPKTKRVYEMITSQLGTMKDQLTNSQGETDGSSCTVTKEIADDLYVKVVGGVKKRCIYGIGGVGTSLVTENQSAANIVSSSSSIEPIVSQKMEVERAEMNEKLKGCNEKTSSLEEQLAQTKEIMEQQSQKIRELADIIKKFMEFTNR